MMAHVKAHRCWFRSFEQLLTTPGHTGLEPLDHAVSANEEDFSARGVSPRISNWWTNSKQLFLHPETLPYM